MPCLPPASISTSTKVVESHSSVPSDSGASVGTVYALALALPSATASMYSTLLLAGEHLMAGEQAGPGFARGLPQHRVRAGVALQHGFGERLGLLECDVRGERRHFGIGD